MSRFFGIPMEILPEIKPSSTIFGYISKGVLKGIPIGAVRLVELLIWLRWIVLQVLGDQQAALVGQMCWAKGTAKSTYVDTRFLLLILSSTTFSSLVMVVKKKTNIFSCNSIWNHLLGTGCFILYNTGKDLAFSKSGLLTTVAYKWNDESAVYALEVHFLSTNSDEYYISK